jgi:hypothetical protein
LRNEVKRERAEILGDQKELQADHKEPKADRREMKRDQRVLTKVRERGAGKQEIQRLEKELKRDLPPIRGPCSCRDNQSVL